MTKKKESKAKWELPELSLYDINAAFLSTKSQTGAIVCLTSPTIPDTTPSPPKKPTAPVVPVVDLQKIKDDEQLAKLGKSVLKKGKRGRVARKAMKALKEEIKKRNRMKKFSAFRLYKSAVWKFTREQPLHTLRNFHLRAWDGWHVDHVLSVAEGFRLSLPVETIGHISNLRMMLAEENKKKHTKTVFTNLFNESVAA